MTFLTEIQKKKRSLFSNKTNTSIENKIMLKKIDSGLTEYSSPKTKNFISKPNSKRSSRIGIENTYNLKKKINLILISLILKKIHPKEIIKKDLIAIGNCM